MTYILVIQYFNTNSVILIYLVESKGGPFVLSSFSANQWSSFLHTDCLNEIFVKCEILKETGCTAWVDGHNLLGTTTAQFCMDLAIKKAKGDGIGWVVAKGANHFSIAGHWSLMAEKEGLIGMSFTNTSPKVLESSSTFVVNTV